MKKDSLRLGIETLDNKNIVLEKLGVFFLLATHIEKILAEYIYKKTNNDELRDRALGAKEKEFNRIVQSETLVYYGVITSLLKNFRQCRNDITHKTLIIEPNHFKDVISINWHDDESINKELSDEISVEGYIKFLNDSIKLGRDLLLELVALFLFEGVPAKEFEESKKMLVQRSFCFNNQHC